MFGQNNDHNNHNDSAEEPIQTNDFSVPAAPGAPAGPIEDSSSSSVNPFAPPAADVSTSVDEPSAPAPEAADSLAPTAGNDDLLNIKQGALEELKPLVGHLEQNPEEKFRTTMMMIQASDDHSLIQTAYDTAKEITDEKARAQALLDVVNEINYFTQNHK